MRFLSGLNIHVVLCSIRLIFIMAELRVYFEKQGADRLCGVHCLNALAQSPAFTQTDLNKYASELDKEESSLLAADPTKPKPPRQMTISSLSNQPKSEHQDVSGYFSLAVLEKALAHKFNLSVQNAARKDIIQKINMYGLEDHEGFVVHMRDHWFSARAIPNPQHPGLREWYFLDSLKAGPMGVTENELWGTLQGIIQSGGNVFVLSGGRLPVPPTSASKPFVLKAHQFVLSREEIKKRLLAVDSAEPSASGGSVLSGGAKQKPAPTDWSKLGSGQTLGGSSDAKRLREDDADLRAAMAESLKSLPPLKPEPGSTEPAENICTLLVRLPSGQRMTRRFSIKHDSVDDLFQWLTSIGSGFSASLVGMMEKRGWKLSRKPTGIVTLVSQPGESEKSVKSSLSLSEIGIQSGQEAFNLSS